MSTDRAMHAVRARLGELGRLSAKATASERKILEAAHDRLDTVNAELAKITPRAHTGAGERYQALVLERGQLDLVIRRSHMHLK